MQGDDSGEPDEGQEETPTKYTVTYLSRDGSEELGTEEVTSGEHPRGIDTTDFATKVVGDNTYNFAGWSHSLYTGEDWSQDERTIVDLSQEVIEDNDHRYYAVYQ